MLRWNAIPFGLLFAAVLAAGCQDQNAKEKTAPNQVPPKAAIETPPPLPPPTAAAPAPAPETPPPTAMAPAPPGPEPAPPVAGSGRQLPKETHAKKATHKSRVYTTKSGDTLQSLAKKYYNDPKKWRTIYEANRRQIKDPDKLPVGKKLIIP
jgi:nucleoid-associated protein YgaU